MNAIRTRLSALRRHWVIAVIALVLVILAIVFGVRIGFLPGMAPTSWAVQHHIDEARGAVNYSQFAADPGEANETIEVIRDGSVPAAVREELAKGLGVKACR
ncbi:MAG: hypothetical protein FJW99_03710 [Actinobacteria bacterium]|nr:hypothetical protein [Actinomycetota bacterium]